MHQTNLADAMMDLWSVIKADLTIADVIRPGEGYGPISTIPVDFGCVVAGKDAVAVDATICRMVGLGIDKVTYFKPARKRNLGNFSERSIEIRGRKIEEVFKQLWIPYMGGFEQWPEYKINAKNACSSCQSTLGHAMGMLKGTGEYDKNAGITICIGPKKEIPKGVKPENLILIGNCLKKHRDHGIFVEGCPPNEPSSYLAIVYREDYEGEKTRPESVMERYEPALKAFHEYMLKLREQIRAEESSGAKK